MQLWECLRLPTNNYHLTTQAVDMKNTLVKSKSSSVRKLGRETVPSTRILVFGIGNVKLALPIETISKILKQTTVYGVGLNGVGIAHIGDREVTVVDLHEQLFQSSLIDAASLATYLIVVQNSKGELYGIPVTAVPALREVPLSSIRVLPPSYRDADIISSATHVCHIEQAEAPLTIFMLDVDLLLSDT